jgi:hypothetical protein
MCLPLLKKISCEMVRCEVSVGKIEIKNRDRCRVYLLCILAVYTCCVVKKTIESIDTHTCATCICQVVYTCMSCGARTRCAYTRAPTRVLNFATIKKKVLYSKELVPIYGYMFRLTQTFALTARPTILPHPLM